MKRELGEPRESDQFTLSRLAQALGISTQNLRALERRGRFPEGCEPQIDPATATRYWTAEQVRRLKEWNDERLERQQPVDPA